MATSPCKKDEQREAHQTLPSSPKESAAAYLGVSNSDDAATGCLDALEDCEEIDDFDVDNEAFSPHRKYTAHVTGLSSLPPPIHTETSLSESDYSTNDDASTDCSDDYDSSDYTEYSDGEASDYEDLMKSLPIALGSSQDPPSGSLFAMNLLSTPKHQQQTPQGSNQYPNSAPARLATHLPAQEHRKRDSGIGSSIMISDHDYDLDESTDTSLDDGSESSDMESSESSRGMAQQSRQAMPYIASQSPPVQPNLNNFQNMLPIGSPRPGAPAEGLDLSMLKNLRSELEKVGQMIVEKKEGEKFLRRAHILASINMLAAYIPTCVVDHLGQEIRDIMLLEEEMMDVDENQSTVDNGSVLSGQSNGPEGNVSMTFTVVSDHSEFSLLPSEKLRAARSNRSVRDLTSSLTSQSGDNHSVGNMSNNSNTSGSLDSFLHKKSKRGGSLSFQDCRSVSTDGDDLDLLPAAAMFEGAVMFVDITGFTKLSTILDPECLSKVINSYFQMIVDKVHEFNGDVQKFAGDALFAEWRVTDERSLDQCVGESAACASSMVQTCSDFPVLGLISAIELVHASVSNLNVHVGLGAGKMTGIHVGNNSQRREYLYIGQSIRQATAACDEAHLGEALASKEFIDILSTICQPSEQQIERAGVLATSKGSLYDFSSFKLGPKSLRSAKSRGITDQVDGLKEDALMEYRRLMSLYVHPVVVTNDVAATNGFVVSKGLGEGRERQIEEAEMRSVYVMFINLILPAHLTSFSGDLATDADLIHLLNDVMNLVSKKLSHYCGHLRQFIVDDKGFVMIASFGLRGSTFPNMVSERALPATLLIHQSLRLELGVDVRIGATFGDVYCGAVGGEKRHEYAVMGPSVNLAARLMHSPDNPGILVDNSVRQLASRAYCFNALPSISAKGYAEKVQIFEPFRLTEQRWGSLDQCFIGRTEPMERLSKLVKSTLDTPFSSSKLVFIKGEPGMGKSAFLVHLVDAIEKWPEVKQNEVVLARHVAHDSETFVPFSGFRPIFLSILSGYWHSQEASVDCDSSTLPNTVASSTSTSSNMTSSRIADAIFELGREFGAPSNVVDSLTQIMLEPEAGMKKLRASKKAMASFLTHSFLCCTERAELVAIFVDDFHRIDEISWSILSRILNNSQNIVLVGSSSVERNSFTVSPEFWLDVDDEFVPEERYVEVKLEPFSEEEVGAMIEEKLGHCSAELCSEVMIQSGGMPHFANKIIYGLGHRSSVDTAGEVSLSEIILNRVDNFDLSVRSTLNIGAVLGESFSLGDVVAVLMEAKDAKEREVRTQAAASLKTAVREGILISKEQTVDQHNDTQTFSFRQSVWRDTLLRLMLSSRKRDVHRKTANALESRLDSVEDWLNLFEHWKASGSTNRSTETALKIGKMLSSSQKLQQCIQIYEETLSMFGWNDSNSNPSTGFPSEILELLPAPDISQIVRLKVALAETFDQTSKHRESASTFERVLQIMKEAKAAKDIEDRSIVFPAYAKLTDAVAKGHIKQDVYCRYEQSLLKEFITETRVHGRLIHHIQALYLQMILYSRIGRNDKAIAVQSIVKNIYKPLVHTKGLRARYGMDSGAVSFSFCAYLQMHEGKDQEALRMCRWVLKELVPNIESDCEQAFALVYPLLFVLKKAGFGVDAKQVFTKVVLQPFEETEKTSSFTLIEPVFEALMLLLTLTSAKVSEDSIAQAMKFVSDRSNLSFSADINLHLGRFGRCADSLSAELCLLLAKLLPESSDVRRTIVTHARLVATAAVTFNRKNRLKFALTNIQVIREELKQLC